MEPQDQQKKFRWRYYIDQKFQNQFIIRFGLVIILVALFTVGILWLLQKNPYISGLLPAPVLYTFSDKTVRCGPPGDQFDLRMPKTPFNAYQILRSPLLIFGVINLILIIAFSLFYSHRLAGPIVNIKRALEEMLEGGEAKPIQIRKTDQFQDLVDLLNQLIEKRVK